MQITIDIPDSTYNELQKIDRDIKNTIVRAVELYTTKTVAAMEEPFYIWLKSPVEDRENKTDISENHNKYVLGVE